MSRARRSSRQSANLHEVLSNLAPDAAEGGRAPDLSHSIMGRLGYARVSPDVARRKRLVTWGNRAGVLMVVAIAFGIGYRIFEASPQVRRPIETTIPDAINHDVQMQQQWLEGAIRSIRSISTPRLRIEPIGEGGRDNRGSPAPVPVPPAASPRELQDDVNRSSMAPVRWV